MPDPLYAMFGTSFVLERITAIRCAYSLAACSRQKHVHRTLNQWQRQKGHNFSDLIITTPQHTTGVSHTVCIYATVFNDAAMPPWLVAEEIST